MACVRRSSTSRHLGRSGATRTGTCLSGFSPMCVWVRGDWRTVLYSSRVTHSWPTANRSAVVPTGLHRIHSSNDQSHSLPPQQLLGQLKPSALQRFTMLARRVGHVGTLR